jgi:NADPH:quinone reductase-like Zn-dependent oxidoreductase
MIASSMVLHTGGKQTHSTMMAWRVHEFGPPEVMKFERAPRPEPGSGEVLIKVEAVGVGPWDAWIRAGKSALPQPLPLTLGSDLSGEIAAVGTGVSELRVGDQVYGVTNRDLSGPTPSTPWLPREWSRTSQPRLPTSKLRPFLSLP